jgi:uncharacterized membrane protein YdjX (TVP38/TMEM64 family)
MSESHSRSASSFPWLKVGLLAIVAIVVVAVFILDIQPLLIQLKDFVLNPDAQNEWFLLALLMLPIVGIPISLFCIMAGAKFGFAWGMVTIGVSMAAHMMLCFLAMHSFVKPVVNRFLKRRGYQAPEMKTSSQVNWALGIVALPVLPYMVKNVLLASGTLRLRTYLIINWPLQMLHAVPYVMFSGAVKTQNLALMWVALGVFLALWLGTRFIRKRNDNTNESSAKT